MTTFKFETVFNINDDVYHVTPDSPVGVIIDIHYSVINNIVEYEVAFGHGNIIFCKEHELNRDKRF